MLRRQVILIILILVFVLAACGGGDEEPATTPQAETTTSVSDTAVPTETAVPEPTATADPTANFIQTTSEMLGVTISHPAEWVAEIDENSGEMQFASNADIIDAGGDEQIDGALVVATAMEKEMFGIMGDDVDTEDPVALLELFANLLVGDGEDEEMIVLEAPKSTTIDGQDAAIAVYEITGEQQAGIGVFVAIIDGERVVLSFGAITNAVIAEYRPTVDAILNSIKLSEPVMVEAEPVVEATAVPVAEATAVPEPVEPSVDMVGAPVFTLFDGLPEPALESGLSMYSNGNIVYDVAYYDGVVWAATDGGLVAWDAATGDLLRKWTTLDGLPHNVVHTIVTCALGGDKLALGTEGGLSLYDPNGGTFENFTQDNSGLHSDAGIVSLACVPNLQTLVIGYDLDGVEVYDYAADTGVHYEPFDHLESGFAEAVAVVGDLEEIWVAHIGAVSVIRADGSISYYDSDNSGLDDPNTDDFEHFVNDIVVDANGTVWFGQGGGLTRVDGDNAFTFFNGDDVTGWPFFTNVAGLAAAPDGTLYTNAGFGGICHFDPATVNCVDTFEDEPGMGEDFNTDIIVVDNGNLYYASEEGVSAYDGSGWQLWAIDEKPEANSYRTIAQGADGSVWVGGFYGAQWFYAYDADGDWVNTDDHLSYVSVNTFYPTRDGMWVGHSNGASFYTYADGSWMDFERADEAGAGIYKGDVSALEYDNMGRLWFGTTAGVTVWDGSTFTYFDLLTDAERTEERSPRWVYDFQRDGDTMWVGTAGVLLRFDAGAEITEIGRYDDENSNLPWVPGVRSVVNDADGNILVAADSYLYQFNGSDDFDELYQADTYINAALLDADSGTLWLSLNGAGVLAYENGEWINLTTADGLPSNLISGNGVLVDYLGTLWVAAGEGGLMRFVP
ncbi:MAG: hypothetical protein R3E31_03535 [Chloroflexota bacterium]